jgi:hypothetical protein
MTYSCELDSGQRIYLDNQGHQTVITLSNESGRQQQQSSSSFTTGKWTSPPEIFRRDRGVVIKITTAEGEHQIRVQGNSISVESSHVSLGNSQRIQVQQSDASTSSGFSMKPMEPMKPMKPMKMGDMSMNMNPMEMRMGNMSMQMGRKTHLTRRFCSQCGNSVEPNDRFCSSCGHQL